MKKGFALLLICLIGCQPFERGLVEPALLFQTWIKTEGTVNGKSTKFPLMVEFDRTGKLLYGTEKRDGWCCAPHTFESSERQIKFFFPESPEPVCHLVDCAIIELTPGVIWRIEKLTASELILTTENGMITFEAEK